MTFQVQNLQEFHKFVQDQILSLLKPHTLILLEGEVGAGKTELVKTLCQLLGLQDVQSPTFAFHNLYSSAKLNLHHVDLYRLKSEEDLESIGFWDLFENRDDVILVEWSNYLHKDVWPWDWKQIRIQIEKQSGTSRKITLEMLN